MKILAIDSSGLVASVALLADGALVAEYTVNNKLTHSQTLLPMLDALKEQTELDLNTLDAIAVAAGPGSFTGLRIGAATAKGLALSLGKPIVPVPTVDALAYACFGAKGLVCPMLDARRDQVYTGLYQFCLQPDGGMRMEILLPQHPASVSEIADEINARGEPVLLTGDGADAQRKNIEALLTVPFSFAPAHLARQRAGAVAALAEQLAAKGAAVDGASFAPTYLRASQAERERTEKTTSLCVRPMTQEDVGSVLVLDRAVFSVPWTEESFRKYLNRPESLFFVAEDCGKLVGYSCAIVAADEGDIVNVAVRPDARRRGIGRALVGALLERARSQGAKRLFLEVRKSNEAAQALYAGFGFVPVGERKNYYHQPTEDALLMRREMEESDK